MNICLPYTDYLNDLFRCLMHDLHLEFTEAPVPGKYTREIGKTLSAGTLCAGLETMAGTAVECYYLGADTLLVFAPCGGCSAERIKAKLANCLEASGARMNFLSVPAGREAQKPLWERFKAVSPVPFYAFREVRRRFYECCSLLGEFLRLKNEVCSDALSRCFIEKIEAEIHRTRTLLDFKVLLAAFNKKLAKLKKSAARTPFPTSSVPYAREDYFDLKHPQNARRFLSFFEKTEQNAPPVFVENCPVGGDVFVFLNTPK